MTIEASKIKTIFTNKITHLNKERKNLCQWHTRKNS